MGWREDEQKRLQAKLNDPNEMYVKNGIKYWKSNDAVIPPFVYEDAGLPCPPQQQAARDAELDEFTKRYKQQQTNMTADQRAEQAFEIQAAFGPGERVINVFTGDTWDT